MSQKMDPAIKKVWVGALRSGKYTQATGALHTTTPAEGEKFCCLGVLCDIAVRQGVVMPEPGDLINTVGYAGETGVLPGVVSQWAGLDDNNNGSYGPAGKWGQSNALSSDNDFGKTFAEIADIIEANF